jgi:hypothetical protein
VAACQSFSRGLTNCTVIQYRSDYAISVYYGLWSTRSPLRLFHDIIIIIATLLAIDYVSAIQFSYLNSLKSTHESPITLCASFCGWGKFNLC